MLSKKDFNKVKNSEHKLHNLLPPATANDYNLRYKKEFQSSKS